MSNRVRMDRVMAQVDEALGLTADGYLEVELLVDNHTCTALLRLPVADEDQADVLLAEVQDEPTARDKAIVLLGGRPDITGAEQLELFERAGYEPKDVVTLFFVEMRKARERLERVGKAPSRR